MAATDKVFSGSIPEIYDRLMVPLIFEPYARDLADRIAAASRGRVLETAAGTGVLTRALASRLPANVSITATDLNEPMLAQARRTCPIRGSRGGRPMRWRCRSTTEVLMPSPASSARCFSRTGSRVLRKRAAC